MELERIYATAKRLKQSLHCSQQKAEYMASVLAMEDTVSEDSFQLLAEIRAFNQALALLPKEW